MAMKKVKVRITDVGGHCKVEPGIIVVNPGQTIKFTKAIPGAIYIQVSGMRRKTTIKENEDVGELEIAASSRVGIYPYAVFCYERKAFCTGSSMPIIIVPRIR